MALEGTIKEFGLADILQLISLQKKGGVLNVHQTGMSATITFYKGQIVYAVSSKREETAKVGRLLITAGKLTEKEVNEALRLQEKTGDRIGKILVTSGFIAKEALQEALQTQIKDVVFQILRWKEGGYRFDIQDVECDKEYETPVPTDFVLMEGIRMLDEWPYIEGIIPSDTMIFSQSYKSEETEKLFSSLSTKEMEVFNLINGQRDVKEIVGLTQFSEFEVYKMLATLQVSGLISGTSLSTRIGETITGEREERRRLWIALQIAILSFTVSFILIWMPVKEMMRINEILAISEMLKIRSAQKELSYIHRAIHYYFLVHGELPDSLEILHSEQFLKARVITDPWGNPFVFERDQPAGSDYRLYSKGMDRVASTRDDLF